MNREIIKLSDYTNEKYHFAIGSSSGLKFVKEKIECIDFSKQVIDYIVIVERLKDNKFFQYRYSQYNEEGSNMQEQEATEVFPKQVINTIYE